MNSIQTEDFTWKRQPEGGYTARHGFWVYNVWRNDRAAKGHQWVLKAWPEGNPEAAQERTGLATATVAKKAAERTNCFICGRFFPFGTLKRQHSKLSLLSPTWICRDEKPCRAERERITAESRERILEMRRIDHTEIFVREAQYGPELVFRSGDNGTVINVTEGDLDTVRDVVDVRRGAIIRMENGVQTRTDCGHSFTTCHSNRCFRLPAPDAYARKLTEVAEAKTRVRELESAALALHDRARAEGTTEDKLRAIEAQHGFGLPAIPYTGGR